MKIELKGRKAVVTGSTAGIGRAIAEGLARAGASVVINGRGEERVSAALREMRENLPAAEIAGFAADLATPQGADAFTAQAPDADILVNNLGTAKPKAFLELTDDDWRDMFELNVMSGIRMTRHYLPAMTKRGWGRVVFVSSESALAIPKEMIDYGMTKTAQLAISRGVAESVAGTGVTVNALAPAVIYTPLVEAMPQEQVAYMTSKIPMQRCAQLEELVSTVEFAVSPGCSFTTGFTFDLSGGRATY